MTCYVLIACRIAASSVDSSLHTGASNEPVALKKEHTTTPHAERRLLIKPAKVLSLDMGPIPPHTGVHPPPSIINAMVKNLIPEAEEICGRLFVRLISMYGAKNLLAVPVAVTVSVAELGWVMLPLVPVMVSV